MSEQHSDNVYAFDKSRKTVYVLDVPKGKNDYTCCGCGKEVIAIHRSRKAWQPYFKHHVTDAKTANKCTYRDETYRHKLAKEILQRIKRIRVPGVKKNPPKGMKGEPMIIAKPTTIQAAKVLVERQFYEGEDNKVHYGVNPKIKIREHLIKPDITFLDDKNKPILFIEVVATHAVNQVKYLKIKRLGIDTIQVKIPKESPKEIEKSFFTVKHTKWIYNNELESTSYIPTTGTHSPGVSTADEFQEGIYDETLSCRRAQIGNLIRAINRCLESEHYTRDAESTKRDIKNAESVTIELRKRYDRIREEADKRAFEPFENEIERINEEQRGIEEDKADLEKRYREKRDEVERGIEAARSKYQSRIKELGGKRRSFKERKEELRREAEHTERIFKELSDDIERIGQTIEEAQKQFRSDFRSMGENYRKETENLRKEEVAIRERIRNEKERLEKEERSIDERFKQLEIEIREGFRKRSEYFARAVRERNAEGDSPDITQLRRVIRKHQQFQSIIDLQKSIKRVRAARKWFETAPWKSPDW